MSYDLYLRSTPCPHCGRRGDEPQLPDPTYNLTPIFHLALTGDPMPSPEVSEGESVLLRKKVESPRGLRVLNGRKASDTVVMIEAAIQRINERRDEFLELEPENKWGTVEGALFVLAKLAAESKNYPDNVWEVG